MLFGDTNRSARSPSPSRAGSFERFLSKATRNEPKKRARDGRSRLARGRSLERDNEKRKARNASPSLFSSLVFSANEMEPAAPPDLSPVSREPDLGNWKRHWSGVYQEDIVDAVGSVRRKHMKDGAPAPAPGPAATVYFVSHQVFRPHGKPEIEVIGTYYYCVVEANDHALAFFAAHYPNLLGPVAGAFVRRCEIMGLRGEDEYGKEWSVDSDGCLDIDAKVWGRHVNVFVSEQVTGYKDECRDSLGGSAFGNGCY